MRINEKESFVSKGIRFEAPYSACTLIVINPVLERLSILNLAFTSIILLLVWFLLYKEGDVSDIPYVTVMSKV